MTDPPDKPLGKDAVSAALVEAAIELIVNEGTHVSVRQVAAAAGVNHGLVHTYFGSKEALLAAAFDEINRRASADLDAAGFPPVDLARRRGGELGKAIARMRLDEMGDSFSSHPVTSSWRDALAATRPDLDSDEIDTMVVTASTLALGWAVFGDQLCDTAGLEGDRRAEMERHVVELYAKIGGIPDPPE